MTIKKGSSADGHRSGLAGRIAAKIIAATKVLIPQFGPLNRSVDDTAAWFTEALDNDKVGLSQIGQDGLNKGQVLVASGPNMVTALATGVDGQVITADSTSSSGLKWGVGGGSVAGPAGGDLTGTYPNPTLVYPPILKSTLATTGDILAASAANTPSVVSPGAAGTVLTSNGAGVVSSFQAAGWTTIYEVDFTSLATQNLKPGGDGQTVATIDGKTWGVYGSSAATTLGITNGTGLVMQYSGSGSDPTVFAKFTNLFSGSSGCPYVDQFELWVRMSVSNKTGVDWGRIGINEVNSSDGISGLYSLIGARGTSAFLMYTNYANVAASTNLSDDVLLIKPRALDLVDFWSGVWSSGWPARNSLHQRGTLGGPVGPSNPTISASLTDMGVYISCSGSPGSSLNCTIKNLRIRALKG